MTHSTLRVVIALTQVAAVLAVSVTDFDARAQAVPGTAPTTVQPARATANQLPALGDGGELAISAERRLGDRIAREIYRDPDYIDDPVLVEYVDGVWQALLAAARARGELSPELDQRFAWEIMLGRDRTVNAFALPGGYMGLHLGLISVVNSRDELASVMGHELSHVTQRHISRLMTKQSAQTPWVIGAMILGALAASKNPDAANAMLAGGQAVAMQNQLNFSRDMEREADRVGFGVMTQAGFAPQGFVSMFDKLQQASRLNDNGSFPYLRSHPLTTERIADVQARLPSGPGASVPIELTMQHAMITARSRVLSNPGVDVLRQLAAEANHTPPSSTGNGASARLAGTLYASTLAAMRLRDLPAAQAYMERLAVTTQPNDAARRLTRLLSVELAMQAGQPVSDLPALGAGRPELLLSSQALTARGRGGEATGALQTWVAKHPRDAMAWQVLAAAYAAQGQSLRALRAEAEGQVAHFEYAGAMDRFRAAQALARSAPAGSLDYIEASIIDTRARQVQLLLREQALER